LKYSLHYEPQRASHVLYARDEHNYFVLENGRLVAKKISNPWCVAEPLMYIPNPEDLLKALTEANIKSPDGNFVEGELKATKEHLADMRKLAFKKK